MLKLKYSMKEKELERDKAYYHLPGLFEFYELYRVFYLYFGNIENIFMTGVKSVRFMEHLGTASGVVVVWNVETADHRKF